MGIVRRVYNALKTEAEKVAAETRTTMADVRQSVDRMLADLPVVGTTAAVLPGIGKMLVIKRGDTCHVMADGRLVSIPWEKFQADLTVTVANIEAQDLRLGKLMLDLLSQGLDYGALRVVVTVAAKQYALSFTEFMQLLMKLKAHAKSLELGISEIDASEVLQY